MNLGETCKAQIQVLRLDFIPRATTMKKESGLTRLVFGGWIKGRAGVEAGKPVRSLLFWPM